MSSNRDRTAEQILIVDMKKLIEYKLNKNETDKTNEKKKYMKN